MTVDELLDQFYARFGSEQDSKILGPTILKAAEVAMENVARSIARNKPLAHERLIVELSATPFSTSLGYNNVALTGFDTSNYKLLVEPHFTRTTVYKSSGRAETEVEAKSVNSFDAMRPANDVGVIYYYVGSVNLYFNIPATMLGLGLNTIAVRHYVIPLTLAGFPTQLREYLIDEIGNMLMPEIQKNNVTQDPNAGTAKVRK